MNQLEKLEVARSAYLYLSLPFPTFPYLSLPSHSFSYLFHPFSTISYLFLTIFSICALTDLRTLQFIGSKISSFHIAFKNHPIRRLGSVCMYKLRHEVCRHCFFPTLHSRALAQFWLQKLYHGCTANWMSWQLILFTLCFIPFACLVILFLVSIIVCWLQNDSLMMTAAVSCLSILQESSQWRQQCTL